MDSDNVQIREYDFTQIREAINYALRGGVALHHAGPHCVPGQRELVRVAHLLDQDPDRLTDLAAELGVQRVVVMEKGTRKQHIDLWGQPLSHAISDLERDYCKRESEK